MQDSTSHLETLRDFLRNQELPLNGRLPPERTLCEQLGMSRAKLRKALAQLEAERLRARLEHSQSQVDVLTLSLETARAQSEHLAALCGRYESNCVALQLAAEAGDQLTEAFDLLVALQDSELALLLASCRAAGLGTAAGRLPAADAETALRVASEQRRSCENVARHALSRLDRRAAAAFEDGSQNTR